MREPSHGGDGVYQGVALSLLRQSRPVEVARILARYRTPEAVFGVPPAELARVERVRPDIADALRDPDLDARAAREIAAARLAGLDLVPLGSPEYPGLLAEIYDPPPVIYVKGKLDARDGEAIAIVGSRGASTYGLGVAERLARDLGGAGLTVVSGLARGIDAAAHRGALDAGGRTIAVLACGLDRVYPPEHGVLANRIAGSGAVIGELPLGTPPVPHQFPARNRLISGLALGTIIVEAAERSGSLITARTALDQGRDVFAVPGPVTTSTSAGTNRLIQDGAKLVRNATDVLDEFAGWRTRGVQRAAPAPLLDPEEHRLFGALSDIDPLGVDTLAEAIGAAPAVLLDRLLALELRGLIARLPGLRFVRRAQSW